MAGSAELAIQIAAINRASVEMRKIAGDIRGISTAAVQTTAGVNRLNASMGGAISQIGKFGAGFIGAQVSMSAFQGGLRGTIGAAIAFESSFAGVRKTVDATEAEFNQLAAANREMAKSLPLSANGLNDITALAGQLGVRGVDNLTKFTRVIADLGNTTNLATEEAAQSFAQIANVVGLPIKDVDRLGSAIVDLGNKSATTERDIVSFVQRIAGAGKIAGLTSSELAGIGAAFASTGVEAEAGGTAIQKVLIGIRKAAAEGGADLQVFADAAGLSAAEFQKLALSNGAEAFTRFVEGLAKAGDDAFATLEKLGLEDQRLIRSFLAVAGAGDLLRRSIDTGNAAFRENTALTEEAEKRYATTASQLQILKNNFTDAGISIGQVMLPAINDTAAGAVDLVNAAKPLAPALKSVATAAALAGAGFVALKAASAAASAITAFQASVTGAVAAQRLLTAEVIGAGPVLTTYTQSQRAAALSVAGTAAASNKMLLGFGAVTIGLVAADLAMRKFTGGGLIDFLTDSKRKAEQAAKAQSQYNLEMERFADLQERLGEAPGRQRFGQELATDILKAATSIEQLEEQMGRLERVRLDTPSSGLKELNERIAGVSDALDVQKPRIEAAKKAFDDANLTYVEQEQLLREFPGLYKHVKTSVESTRAAYAAQIPTVIESTNEQREFQRALRDVAKAGTDQGSVLRSLAADAQAAIGAYEGLQAAVKNVEAAFDIKTLDELRLDRQIAEIDALIAGYKAAGKEVPEEFTRLRDAWVAQRGAAEATTDAVVANFAELAAKMREHSAEGAAAADYLSTTITGLPEQTRIEIITALNRVAADEAIKIADRLTELAAVGISIPVAFQLMAEQAAPKPRQFGSQQGFAEGGFVNASKTGEMAMLHGNELVLPLDNKKRTMDLLGQLGMRGFEKGGFTEDAFLKYVQGGGLPAIGGDGASVTSAVSEFLALAQAIQASGQTALEFIAALELYQEEQSQANNVAEDARRAAIELTKLAIVLGKQGISGEAFVASQFLRQVADNFAQAGVTVTNSILGILTAMQDFSAQAIEFANRLSGRGMTQKSQIRLSSGEVISEEEWKKRRDEGFRDPDAVREVTQEPLPEAESPLEKIARERREAQEGTKTAGMQTASSSVTFNGPVTVNTTGSVDEAIRDLALHVR